MNCKKCDPHSPSWLDYLLYVLAPLCAALSRLRSRSFPRFGRDMSFRSLNREMRCGQGVGICLQRLRTTHHLGRQIRVQDLVIWRYYVLQNKHNEFIIFAHCTAYVVPYIKPPLFRVLARYTLRPCRASWTTRTTYAR